LRKQTSQTATSSNSSGSSSSGGFWDLFCLEALFSEFFPVALLVLVLLGGFFLLYWLGKKVWEQAPQWKAALAQPGILKNVLLFVGAFLGLSLLALDFVPVHTLSLNSIRATLCIIGVGIALYGRRTLWGAIRDGK
jgi:hypothetical protein